MILPIFFLIASSLGVVFALIYPGASDWLLLALPCALASLILLGVEWTRRTPAAAKNWVIIDGSNVMHWKDGTAQIETVREVASSMTRSNLTAGVIFDANVGYKVAGRYMNDHALSRALGLPKDRVLIVPKGEPADPMILKAARDFGAQVVTNDRFRDWVDSFPEVADPATFVRGGYRNGKLWLDL